MQFSDLSLCIISTSTDSDYIKFARYKLKAKEKPYIINYISVVSTSENYMAVMLVLLMVGN
jgi:hypothetical protein